MADITKCEGGNCPIKENCYRYTAPEGMYQSYFVEIPYNGKECNLYWGPNADTIWEDLKNKKL